MDRSDIDLKLLQSHSQYMIALTRSGYEDVYAYLMFCPMAFNNQGAYWLQPNSELLNPYFGDAMLRCGDHLETFEANQDRKSTRLNSSHVAISYAVFCLKKKIQQVVMGKS